MLEILNAAISCGGIFQIKMKFKQFKFNAKIFK